MADWIAHRETHALLPGGQKVNITSYEYYSYYRFRAFIQRGEKLFRVGSALLEKKTEERLQAPSYLGASSLHVKEDWRRMGVATALYDAAEELTGRRVVPSTLLTRDGAAFWEARQTRLSNA